MKRMLAMLAVAAVVVTAGVWAYFARLSGAHEAGISAISVADVDLSSVADGIYTGSHSVFPVSVEVKVTVLDHQIADIELVKHRNGKGAAAEAITDRVVEAKSLLVDVVSGATSSSKVILKAIENALISGAK